MLAPPIARLDAISRAELNACLTAWGHRMGPWRMVLASASKFSGSTRLPRADWPKRGGCSSRVKPPRRYCKWSPMADQRARRLRSNGRRGSLGGLCKIMVVRLQAG